MRIYSEYDMRYILYFQETIASINRELKKRNFFSIEYLLINYPTSYVIMFLDKIGLMKYDYEFKYFFEQYCDYVKRYYDDIMIKEGSNDDVADSYFSKLKEPTGRIYPKSNIGLAERDAKKALQLMKEAIRAYYDVYKDRTLIARLQKDASGSAEHLTFVIKEQELLHLLGVTASQLRSNPDFIRLTGNRKMSCVDIIEWIMKDIDGNNDLLQYNEDFLRSIAQSKDFQIIENQYALETRTQILNYGKIRLKSQAFLKYGPLEGVSLVAKLNKPISKNAHSRYVMVSRADALRKYPWAYFGQVRTNGINYIETLQINSEHGKKDLLKGSRPALVTGIISFSDEEQLDFVLEAYVAFRDWLEFEDLIKYYKALREKTDKKTDEKTDEDFYTDDHSMHRGR